MTDPKIELLNVKEELLQLEEELERLLERQQKLLDKKQQLETAIKDAASAKPSPSLDSWNKSDFKWSKELVEKRESVFGLTSFRPLQLQTINVTMSGHDCILIMPTGGGKSLCYQLPALVSKGVTLVISPLVSLMEDQVMALEKLGVNAQMLNASTSQKDATTIQNAMTDPKSDLKLLYVTPEKLAKSKRFMAKLEKMYECGRFARIAIDEVHCCSQWGHDFRPDYKFLGILKRQFAGVPILGLTATATSHVTQDVKKILGLQSDCVLFKASFNRHNLYYEVYPKPATEQAALDEMHKKINARFKNQSGIIYCLTQKDAETVTQGMQSRGIQAGCYHGNLHAANRSAVHSRWIQNKIQVVVATIAFGMGIDKADVRFVIHYSISKSMENYYQESGRAGRDDKKAHCILFASYADLFRQSTMVFTEQTGLEKLYAMATYAFKLNTCRRTLIAQHFGETWNVADCKGMCDTCDPSKNVQVLCKDVTKYAKDLIAILKQGQRTQQRLTGLKLLEAWLGKGASSLRLTSVTSPQLSRADCERVIVFLITEQYLREDFHFTPYNTISYLLPGSRAGLIENHGKAVSVDITARSVPSPAASSSSSSSPLKKSQSVKLKASDLKVINHSKSAFISHAASSQPESSSVAKSQDNDKSADQKTSLHDKTNTSKRKVMTAEPINWSDDDDDLDFGDLGTPKKSNCNDKTNTSKRKVVTVEPINWSDDDDDLDFGDLCTPKKRKTCIVIESEEDS